jgi:hypothetical protein
MSNPALKNYSVTVEQSPDAGSVWLVRVYRRGLLWKRRVSSDWFLDPDQARKFAGQLTEDLSGDGNTGNIESRQPGWVLHRAPR